MKIFISSVQGPGRAESFEQRQSSTAEALEALLREVETNEVRKKEQAEKSFDGLTYFVYLVYRSLLDAKIENAEAVSRKIRRAFADFPNWKKSENALRELRKQVTFAIFAETEDLDRVTAMVDELFNLLEKAGSHLSHESSGSKTSFQSSSSPVGG